MAGTTTARWSPLAVVPAALLGVIAALVLAPSDLPLDSLVRTGADVAGAVVLGFGLLILWARDSRHVDDHLAWRGALVAAACWAVSEVTLLVLGAARSDAVSATAVSLGTFTDYVQNIANGRIGSAVVVVALATAVLAATALRTDLEVSGIVVVVPTAVALIARPMTGHMAQHAVGALLVAVHVVAASVWLGLLVAMAVTLRSRTAWADLLPRYSAAALWCVVAVAVTGVVNAAVRLTSVTALVDTDYGRLILLKSVLLVALVIGGWWRRRTWVSVIGAHTTHATVSTRRAVVETAAMAAAFGVAAALATTA
ncbi:CopD family protein [Rhodococcus sp. BP-149]|uniref:CopD family protein n=1 Tax=unclassified Rhodococcus (in: high G+C Gram-positive bacteria) TaxID=192944 RepID=UPI001C9B434F|nr:MULTISPECIES: CopD family protein [unclassified Rhodococcus (in: high G+C Gram-positive bacteria)]MBY6687860.1 CopD family protein [Rhodococcus sp. BP-288]MBY6696201.1 CopD family protein [Rhodococcus sp. BP-188]MBY6700793.1 CopD family protein [Rhodococcus sp. BP-285]MBY6701680.1 CopD family protein [Rhodococcus sp. BP-283]MBY6712681.1 CopD family protein [Rhodococcus sp. BP-160]